MAESARIISIVGPESTGKTTLANQLATHFKAQAVPEFAREYLTRKNGHYEQKDLLTIAESQAALEKMYLNKCHELLFCDTDVLTIMVWHQFKYKKRNKKIEQLYDQQPPRKYLLTYPDLPWEPDPLRESPNDMKRIFNTYKMLLKIIDSEFAVIEGGGDKRTENAIAAVNQFDFG